MDKNKQYLIALSHFPKFGPKSLGKIKQHFPCLKETFSVSFKKFQKTGINEKVILEFFEFRKNFSFEKTFSLIEKEKIKILFKEDDNYPSLLKEITNPPEILYYKGEFREQDDLPFAIVGTRNHTPQAEIITEKITLNLIENGLTIVSGLALGIDTIAHRTSVKNKKRTVAVLGSGINESYIYPKQNKELCKEIIKNKGAIISEFPPNTPPLRYNFPQRNRIISGLSIGTLVVEAKQKSGALITADYALDQNRDVFAVPGNILDPEAFGPNSLIKQGAQVVTSGKDILETLNLKEIKKVLKTKKIIPESKEEKIILKHLSAQPKHINDIIHLTNLPASVINGTLTIMEMKGMVKNIGGMRYMIL